MENFTCKTCKKSGKNSALKNDPWAGWKNGKITRVDNYRCPECGGNDLTFHGKTK